MERSSITSQKREDSSREAVQSRSRLRVDLKSAKGAMRHVSGRSPNLRLGRSPGDGVALESGPRLSPRKNRKDPSRVGVHRRPAPIGLLRAERSPLEWMFRRPLKALEGPVAGRYREVRRVGPGWFAMKSCAGQSTPRRCVRLGSISAKGAMRHVEVNLLGTRPETVSSWNAYPHARSEKTLRVGVHRDQSDFSQIRTNSGCFELLRGHAG